MKTYYKNLLKCGIISREKYFDLITDLKVKEAIDKLLGRLKSGKHIRR
jgi:hypothetical protein